MNELAIAEQASCRHRNGGGSGDAAYFGPQLPNASTTGAERQLVRRLDFLTVLFLVDWLST